MQQITLNFDTTDFDGFDGLQDYFSHASKTLRDEQGRVVKQSVQAMEMDFSPSHWSQKVNGLNNAAITLTDADGWTEKYGDVSWIYYLIDRHIIKRGRNRDDLLKARAEIDRQLSNLAAQERGL